MKQFTEAEYDTFVRRATDFVPPQIFRRAVPGLINFILNNDSKGLAAFESARERLIAVLKTSVRPALFSDSAHGYELDAMNFLYNAVKHMNCIVDSIMGCGADLNFLTDEEIAERDASNLTLSWEKYEYRPRMQSLEVLYAKLFYAYQRDV